MRCVAEQSTHGTVAENRNAKETAKEEHKKRLLNIRGRGIQYNCNEEEEKVL